MNTKELKRLKQTLHTFSEKGQQGAGRGFAPEFAGRVLHRLHGFSRECEKCTEHLQDLAGRAKELQTKKGDLARQDFRLLQKGLDRAVSHLQNRHKLVVAGQSLAISLALGLSLGVAFGVTIFGNIGLGLALGVALGIVVGTVRDAGAKKTDRLI